jgi:hypothetical protein
MVRLSVVNRSQQVRFHRLDTDVAFPNSRSAAISRWIEARVRELWKIPPELIPLALQLWRVLNTIRLLGLI